MEITLDKEELIKGLKKVVPIAHSSLQPILNNILIEAKGGKIYLTGSNGSTIVKTEITPKKYDKVEDFVIPADMFQRVAETFKNEITLKDNELIENKSKVKFETQKANNYPRLEFHCNEDFIKINSDILIKGIKGVINAVSEIEMNVMGGVNIAINDGIVKFCGCDGGIISVYTDKIDAKDNYNFTLPKKLSEYILKTINSDEEIHIKIDNNGLLYMKTKDTNIKASLMDGNYPKYEGIIKRDYTNSFKIDKNFLISLLKKCQIFANSEKTNKLQKKLSGVKFGLTGVRLDINYKDIVSESTMVEHSGADIKICLAIDYLNKAIDNFCGDLEIKFGATNSEPIVINDDELMTLIMPIVG